DGCRGGSTRIPDTPSRSTNTAATRRRTRYLARLSRGRLLSAGSGRRGPVFEQVVAELLDVDAVLGQQQPNRVGCACTQAEARDLAATAAAQPGPDRVPRDAQHAVEQVLGTDLDLAALAGGGAGDQL